MSGKSSLRTGLYMSMDRQTHRTNNVGIRNLPDDAMLFRLLFRYFLSAYILRSITTKYKSKYNKEHPGLDEKVARRVWECCLTKKKKCLRIGSRVHWSTKTRLTSPVHEKMRDH